MDPKATYRWIGSGLYTVADASRLTKVSRGRIRRWMKGYSFWSRGEVRSSPPVFQGELGRGEDEAIVLSFKDLIEIRYVHAFLEVGVSWKTLRDAHEKAAALMKTKHPFATRRFDSDGHTILTRVGAKAILDLVKDQLNFARIVEHHLLGVLDFEDSGAVRWWPMGKKRPIVIDGGRSFGQPIVSGHGVPTAVLHRAYIAESQEDGDRIAVGSEGIQRSASPAALSRSAVERVAKWFSVEKRSVRAAIEYELRLAA